MFKFTDTQYLTFSRLASNHGDSVQKRMTESDARSRLGKRELSQTFRPSAPDLDEVRPRIPVRAREQLSARFDKGHYLKVVRYSIP